MRPPSVAGAVEQIITSYNKRFGEMSVGGEVGSLLHPLTASDSSGHCTPYPPLRQAAGALYDIHPAAVRVYWQNLIDSVFYNVSKSKLCVKYKHS